MFEYLVSFIQKQMEEEKIIIDVDKSKIPSKLMEVENKSSQIATTCVLTIGMAGSGKTTFVEVN